MMFTDTVTLYNYLGESGGEAVWQRTLIKNVRVAVTEGGAGRDMKAERGAVMYVFDMSAAADRTYLPKAAFDIAADKTGFYTLAPGDCFACGECTGSTPGGGGFRVSEVGFFDMGSSRTRHKRVRGS